MANDAVGTYLAGTKVKVNGKTVWSKHGELVVDEDGNVSSTGDIYFG